MALGLACQFLIKTGRLTANPLTNSVAAISCGIYQNEAVLDLDYAEDSTAEVDANFVLTSAGGIVEIQGTAEHSPFSETQFNSMLRLAQKGILELTGVQKEALGS